tara:strand:+ start:265 stop:687 length:423 start_codon:yes stop_codon:yes gene_type:complete
MPRIPITAGSHSFANIFEYLDFIEFMNHLSDCTLLGDKPPSVDDITAFSLLRKNIRKKLKALLSKYDRCKFTSIYEGFWGTEYRQDFEKKVDLTTGQFLYWKRERDDAVAKKIQEVQEYADEKEAKINELRERVERLKLF